MVHGTLVSDIIISYNLDFMFLTETWLAGSSVTVLNETAAVVGKEEE